jgi:transcriptional regulator with XRE-family HTH domain
MKRNEFKALRENVHLTQQQFGEILGFGKAGARMRVSEIERGDAPVSRPVEILCQYIEYFGLIPEHQQLRSKMSKDR